MHLKIDTGMHRVGAWPHDALELCRLIAERPTLRLAGVFTHLAVADELANEATARQLARFEEVLAGLPDVHDVHAANSAGAFAHPLARHSFVRAGIAMGDWTLGVVTFATQSAGCEDAHGLEAPLRAYHGDRDEILPFVSSQVVGQLVGGPAEVIICEGAGHLLSEAGARLRSEVPEWIRTRVATG